MLPDQTPAADALRALGISGLRQISIVLALAARCRAAKQGYITLQEHRAHRSGGWIVCAVAGVLTPGCYEAAEALIQAGHVRLERLDEWDGPDGREADTDVSLSRAVRAALAGLEVAQ